MQNSRVTASQFFILAEAERFLGVDVFVLRSSLPCLIMQMWWVLVHIIIIMSFLRHREKGLSPWYAQFLCRSRCFLGRKSLRSPNFWFLTFAIKETCFGGPGWHWRWSISTEEYEKAQEGAYHEEKGHQLVQHWGLGGRLHLVQHAPEAGSPSESSASGLLRVWEQELSMWEWTKRTKTLGLTCGD